MLPTLPAGGGPSQECLVTLVMKVDLGGWLSRRSLIRRLGAPLSETLLRAWLEPMLLSVVMLRDKASRGRVPGWHGKCGCCRGAQRLLAPPWAAAAVQESQRQKRSRATLAASSPLFPALVAVQVEQSRFVVRPYSMGDALEEHAETPRSESTAAASASARGVARSARRCGSGAALGAGGTSTDRAPDRLQHSTASGAVLSPQAAAPWACMPR